MKHVITVRPKMKWLLPISLALLSSGLALGAPLLRVKTGESHQLSELMHVHSSPISWLSVGGKKYMYAKGDGYLNIPGRDQVLFITSNDRETEYTYHFVSLKDGSDISITVHDTGLFLSFGCTDPKQQASFELVEGPKIVIVMRYPDFARRYRFDLRAKTATEERGDDGWDKLAGTKAKEPIQPLQPKRADAPRG